MPSSAAVTSATSNITTSPDGTKYTTSRTIPRIPLFPLNTPSSSSSSSSSSPSSSNNNNKLSSKYPSPSEETTSRILSAASETGFFILTNHGIPQEKIIDEQFRLSREFFTSLTDEAKSSSCAFDPTRNCGWESRSQVRPGNLGATADQKESFNCQVGGGGKDKSSFLWPDERKAGVVGDEGEGEGKLMEEGFREKSLEFMGYCRKVSEVVMVALARGLGFDDGFFIRAHYGDGDGDGEEKEEEEEEEEEEEAKEKQQSVLRLLRYFAVPEPTTTTTTTKEGVVVDVHVAPETYHRAGPHADWGFLTLLFQREGQSGLEICPGREAFTEFGLGDVWTRIEPKDGEIVCNIGDLLMSWSDDKFKSTFHRVRTPREPGVDYFGDRYSIAFFNQPKADCVIQGPRRKYPAITGTEFTAAAMKRNYEALRRTREKKGSVV